MAKLVHAEIADLEYSFLLNFYSGGRTMQLDQRTLEVVLMIVNLMSCAVMFVLWRMSSSEKGPECWALSAAMVAAAFFSMVFYSSIGNYAIFLNNVGTLTSHLFMLEGILRFRDIGQASKRRLFIIVLIVIFIVVSYLNRSFPTARYLFHDFTSVTVMALAAYFILYRTRGMETLVHSISAISFVVLGLFFAYRWNLAYSGIIETSLLGSTQHPFQVILFLMGIPYAIGWTYGLILVVIYRANSQLKNMAAKDALTGLNNRRCFDQVMSCFIDESQIKGQKFLVILLDLNDFKAINDSYGHTFGDLILINVAESIREVIREDDFAVRYGGDEFVLIMRYQQGFDRELMLNRLRHSIEKKFILKERQIRLRVSIGSAVYPDDGRSMDELLFVADHKMYQEKNDRQLVSIVI
jgi:diguanylate cyclase (GGDEF)-like protein